MWGAGELPTLPRWCEVCLAAERKVDLIKLCEVVGRMEGQGEGREWRGMRGERK